MSNPAFDTRRLQPGGHSKEELQFASAVWAAEQLDRQGIPITVDAVRSIASHLSKPVAEEIVRSSKFAVAMESRGIAINPSGMLPEQMHALSIYFDQSTPMSHTQKLRVAGVTNAVWKGWLKQAPFAQRYSELASDMLEAVVPVAKQRLAELVDRGDLKAIQFAMEVTGEYNPRVVGVTPDQALQVVFGVLEDILTPEQLRKVNDGIQRVMSGKTTAPVQLRGTATFAEPSPEEP